MSNTITYDQGEQLPDAHLTVLDDTGTVISLGSGYTFAATVVDSTGSTVLTVSSGITGASTAPNLTVPWPSGFASLAAGRYTLTVTGTRTSDSKPRKWVFVLVIE